MPVLLFLFNALDSELGIAHKRWSFLRISALASALYISIRGDMRLLYWPSVENENEKRDVRSNSEPATPRMMTANRALSVMCA